MDVKRILDESGRYLFLNRQGLVEAFPIIHVETSYIFFTSAKELEKNYDSGYFLASGGAGIVQFEKPVLESLDKNAQNQIKQKIHRVNIEPLDFIITNRRLSLRHELPQYMPILFYVYGEVMSAQLVNISEGGLRMSVTSALQKNTRCHFEIRLPTEEQQILFRTDGIVVYAENTSENKYQTHVGISFVTPDFTQPADEEKYKQSKEKLKNYILYKEGHAI